MSARPESNGEIPKTGTHASEPSLWMLAEVHGPSGQGTSSHSDAAAGKPGSAGPGSAGKGGDKAHGAASAGAEGPPPESAHASGLNQPSGAGVELNKAVPDGKLDDSMGPLNKTERAKGDFPGESKESMKPPASGNGSLNKSLNKSWSSFEELQLKPESKDVNQMLSGFHISS